MALDPNEIGYFITQVGLSAASFGVAQSDINAIGTALFTTFGYKCSPPVTVVPSQGPQLESICVDATCQLDPHANCGLYDNYNGTSPEPATASSCMTSTMTSTSMCPTATCTTATKTMTVTVTTTAKKPKQTQCWCHDKPAKGDKSAMCDA